MSLSKKHTSTLLLVAAMAPGFLACGALKNQKGDEKPKETINYGERELSFKNDSGADICELQVYARDKENPRNEMVFTRTEALKNGESAKLKVKGDTWHLLASTCDGKDLHNGNATSKVQSYIFKADPTLASKTTLTDGSATGDTGQIQKSAPRSHGLRYDYLMRYGKQNLKTAKKDKALAGKLLKAAQTQEGKWKGKVLATQITSPDWYVFRNRRTGIITHRMIYATVGRKFNSGACSIQIHGFKQGHDGTGFNGPIFWSGFTPYRHYVGCDMLKWLGAQEGAATP